MGAFTRAAMVLGVTLAGSVAAVFGADALRDAGYLPQPNETGAPAADMSDTGPTTRIATRFDRFIQSPDLQNRAAAANAACGFGESLSAGETGFWYVGDAPGNLGLYRAESGEGGVLRSFTASGDNLLAYSDQYGELFVQTGEGAFNSRTFVLDEAGEVTFTEPLLERARIALTCDDAFAAADALNAEFAASGARVNPIRSGLNAFVVGDGYGYWDYPRVDGLVETCAPAGGVAALEEGQLTLISAEFDAEAQFSDMIYHEMSGESLSGVAEPMVYLTLARVDSASGYGDIQVYSAPLSWRALLADEDAFSLVYHFEAMELVGFTISGDGSRSHSEAVGGVLDARFPCADPERAVAILEQLADESRATGP
ncbi:hypothetical protein [Oceanicaulis sp.]|uniref:hypothetical protein n=1 Tax=Oceanicaulis sp. TaxID=1924941 RepID=UPI003BA92B2E